MTATLFSFAMIPRIDSVRYSLIWRLFSVQFVSSVSSEQFRRKETETEQTPTVQHTFERKFSDWREEWRLQWNRNQKRKRSEISTEVLLDSFSKNKKSYFSFIILKLWNKDSHSRKWYPWMIPFVAWFYDLLHTYRSWKIKKLY